jgi:ABC-type polysaccharide transport system permease subunit
MVLSCCCDLNKQKRCDQLMKFSNRVKEFSKNKELFFLALPSVLFLLVFSYIPMYGLILPFKNFRIGQGFFKSEWAGLDNFKYLFSNDALRITRNTVLFNIVFIILGLVFAVGIALMLFELSANFIRLYCSFRTLFPGLLQVTYFWDCLTWNMGSLIE